MDFKDKTYLRVLSPKHQRIFFAETDRRHKNETTAVLLALLLGGLGAHKFYLGQNGLGIVYALFSWTFIPAIIAFCELFVISKRVRQYNEHVSAEVVMALRIIDIGAPERQASYQPIIGGGTRQRRPHMSPFATFAEIG